MNFRFVFNTRLIGEEIMVRIFVITAAAALFTWAVSDSAEAFHGHRHGCGYRAPVTAYYAPAPNVNVYRSATVYSSGYRGYVDPGYGYGYGPGGYGYGPYGGSAYRAGRVSVGVGSGVGYGGYGYRGYGYRGYSDGYPGFGYRYGW
ncbi:hypothetical protein [Allorhodopirellula solitaria]|nr:hypothetical protein [Allorhodopirellula solitaria]